MDHPNEYDPEDVEILSLYDSLSLTSNETQECKVSALEVVLHESKDWTVTSVLPPCRGINNLALTCNTCPSGDDECVQRLPGFAACKPHTSV